MYVRPKYLSTESIWFPLFPWAVVTLIKFEYGVELQVHTQLVLVYSVKLCWELPAIYQTTNFSSGKRRRLLVSADWSNSPHSEFKQQTFCKNYFWRSHFLVKSVVSHVWPYRHVAFSLWIFKRYVQKYCYMLGFLGNMTSAPCCISLVTQQFLLRNNGFVAFP
jgi:hypothetical protein